MNRINNTDYDYLEPHYFDPNHGYRFIGYKDEIAREYLNWERNGLSELQAWQLSNKYEEGYTINEGMLWQYNSYVEWGLPLDTLKVDNSNYRKDIEYYYNYTHPNWSRSSDTVPEKLRNTTGLNFDHIFTAFVDYDILAPRINGYARMI